MIYNDAIKIRIVLIILIFKSISILWDFFYTKIKKNDNRIQNKEIPFLEIDKSKVEDVEFEDIE